MREGGTTREAKMITREGEHDHKGGGGHYKGRGGHYKGGYLVSRRSSSGAPRCACFWFRCMRSPCPTAKRRCTAEATALGTAAQWRRAGTSAVAPPARPPARPRAGPSLHGKASLS